jgi:hypothetical protein
MPYPESCPECGGAFRNTGTHFTARRNEIGRHVLLELGCQNTTRRFWWDFTTGNLTADGQPSPIRRANNGFHRAEASEIIGQTSVSTLDPPEPAVVADIVSDVVPDGTLVDDRPLRTVDIDSVIADNASPAATGAEAEIDQPQWEVRSDTAPEATADTSTATAEDVLRTAFAQEETPITEPLEVPTPTPPVVAGSLKDAFVRQLQLDRLTLRQMRSWLMSDEARRAIEVAAGATEATYERLALILFGVDLPQLLGKQATVPASSGISAEERLELQREKARIRARLRRAAAKAARQPG